MVSVGVCVSSKCYTVMCIVYVYVFVQYYIDSFLLRVSGLYLLLILRLDDTIPPERPAMKSLFSSIGGSHFNDAGASVIGVALLPHISTSTQCLSSSSSFICSSSAIGPGSDPLRPWKRMMIHKVAQWKQFLSIYCALIALNMIDYLTYYRLLNCGKAFYLAYLKVGGFVITIWLTVSYCTSYCLIKIGLHNYWPAKKPETEMMHMIIQCKWMKNRTHTWQTQAHKWQIQEHKWHSTNNSRMGSRK